MSVNMVRLMQPLMLMLDLVVKRLAQLNSQSVTALRDPASSGCCEDVCCAWVVSADLVPF